ncbi:MAG: hypothetical protein OXD43_04505, partial [Bacteroidetes bacterium]|nr:hypothetical protein [Bacteroidota bacterium]
RNQNRPKLPQTDSVNLSSPYPRKKIDRKREWGNSVLPEHYEMANLGEEMAMDTGRSRRTLWRRKHATVLNDN